LSVFGELFGPYPYTELDVVETPNQLGGMEYPGLVVIEDGLYPANRGVEWLTAHEVAHQWWFAVVGNDPIRDPWLDEALTQYSTMLYYEFTYGKASAASIVNNVFAQVHQALVREGRDLPVGLPAEAYGPVLYWQVIYDKGALYFHTLRQEVGDEAFFEILQTYYGRYRYRIATPSFFLDVVEDVTGDRHQSIYDAWIGKPGDAAG
jgi:aminopeptidase N